MLFNSNYSCKQDNYNCNLDFDISERIRRIVTKTSGTYY